MIGTRQLILFLRTLFYSAGTGAFVMIIGALAASVLWTFRHKTLARLLKPLFILSCVMIFVPPYVHALAWADLFYRYGIEGLGASLWVMVMALLPVGLGFSLLGFYLVEDAMVEAGRTLNRDSIVMKSIILPIAMPALLTGMIFSFLWTVHDFSVPSLFFVNIYSLEIFAKYSATNNPFEPFMLSLPMIVVATLIIILISSLSKKLMLGLRKGHTKESLPLVMPLWFRCLQIIAIVILPVQISTPMISLIMKVAKPSNIWISILQARRELGFTLLLSTLTATLSVIFALLLAKRVVEAESRHKLLLWVCILFPLAIPAPLVGIGLVTLFSQRGMGFIYGTLWMPVLANMIRFAPLAVVTLSVQLKRMDQGLLDSASVFQKNRIHGFIRVYLPMILPGLISAFLIVFILTTGELGATLLVSPPGRSTLTMRIYNYMHYGSSQMIAGLCLTMLALSLSTGLIVYRVFSKTGGDR
ncbi:MAG: ABC transporter permease subunit [Eubacteriales bacterium]|nr:ABC transporter permease subunit [Eubacteriales bacterium]